MAFLSLSVSGARGRRRRSPGSDAPAEPFRAALRPRASGEGTVTLGTAFVVGLMLGGSDAAAPTELRGCQECCEALLASRIHPCGRRWPKACQRGQARQNPTADVSIPLRADASRLGILQDADKTRTDRSQKIAASPMTGIARTTDRNTASTQPHRVANRAIEGLRRCGYGLHSKK